MDYSKSMIGDTSEVFIKGKFTFADHQVFRSMFSLLNQKDVRNLVFDFKETEFIDSAALGILLLLRDEAEKVSVGLTLRNPNGQIKKMFKVSRFYDLFQIVE
ncbi:MAG: STAS domain-containing protein [Alphaproteobacteria bacterium]|nr:STAS domain-containing protein [Alphaproteobacteria bacterium]